MVMEKKNNKQYHIAYYYVIKTSSAEFGNLLKTFFGSIHGFKDFKNLI